MIIVLDLSKLAKTYTSIYMIVQLLYSTSKYIVECAFGPSACNAISAATVYLQSHNLQHDKTIDHYVIFCAGFSTKRREDFWFCGRILPQQQQYHAHRTQRHLAASLAARVRRAKRIISKSISSSGCQSSKWSIRLFFCALLCNVYDSSLVLLLLQYAKKTRKIVPNIWPNPVQSTMTETQLSFVQSIIDAFHLVYICTRFMNNNNKDLR